MADTPAVTFGDDGNVYILGVPLPPAEALRVLEGLREVEDDLRRRADRGGLRDAFTGLGVLLDENDTLPVPENVAVSPDGGGLLVTVPETAIAGVADALVVGIVEVTDADGTTWRTVRHDQFTFRARVTADPSQSTPVRV